MDIVLSRVWGVVVPGHPLGAVDTTSTVCPSANHPADDAATLSVSWRIGMGEG